MNKLKLFKIVGESFARAHSEFVMGPIGDRKVDRVANKFYKEVADELYPANEHRHEWATSNMNMFYEQECERMQVFRKLQGGSSGTDILEMIRQRKKENDAD